MVVDSSLYIEYLRLGNKAKSTLTNLPADSEIYISVVTIYELYMGANTEERQAEVEYLLEDAIVLPLSKQISIKAAEIYNQLKKKNQIIEFRDIFIAATAIYHQLPIKTLNKKHFDRIEGLELL